MRITCLLEALAFRRAHGRADLAEAVEQAIPPALVVAGVGKTSGKGVRNDALRGLGEALAPGGSVARQARAVEMSVRRYQRRWQAVDRHRLSNPYTPGSVEARLFDIHVGETRIPMSGSQLRKIIQN